MGYMASAAASSVSRGARASRVCHLTCQRAICPIGASDARSKNARVPCELSALWAGAERMWSDTRIVRDLSAQQEDAKL
jgi:hypothetical protein